MLFVSSGTRNAESADIGVYNTFVRNQANGGHADIRPLAGQFKALISTGAVDARDNTGTHPNADIPIYWLSGDKAADDYADLYDGGWDSNAGRYQDGSAVGTLGERVWTGSQSDGTQSNRPTANVVVTVGFTNVSGKEIDSQADDDKSDDRKLYGLSPVFTVVGAPTAPRDVLAWSGDTELGVSWRTPANSGGTPVSFYDLRHRPTTDDDSGTWTEVDSVWSADPGGDLTYTLTGLTNGTSYDVQVRAVNAGFDGEWSATVTATPMAGLSAADPTQVLPDWALTPTGLEVGDRFRLLFVSSGTRNAESADIGVYNTFVQNQAQGGDANLGPIAGQFKALISTSAVDARDNTGTTYTSGNKGVAIYWVGGAKVADDYEDFYDGGWDSNAPKDQSGGDVSGNINVWTGSDSDGTESGTSEQFGAGDSIVQYGRPRTSGEEIRGAQRSADNAHYLYGLSPVFTVVGVPPEFDMDSYSFQLAENADGSGETAVDVGMVGTEEHSGTVTYSITAGNTGDVFVIGSDSGAITYVGGGENFEAFTDDPNVDDDGPDFAFSLTVQAGASGLSADVTVTVAVTDVDEPPGKPAAPTLSAGTATSLTVNWVEPENTGPPITGYNVRHRRVASPEQSWMTNEGLSGATRSITLGNLDVSYVYEVQVQAFSDEGTGEWSDAAAATTAAANSAPAFGADCCAFDLAENADGSVTAIEVGTVPATDSDGHTVSYSITGGNTGNVFSIGESSGVITYTGSGEDHETTASFALTVRATDRIANTDVTVTVNVTDVNARTRSSSPPPRPSKWRRTPRRWPRRRPRTRTPPIA